MNLGPGRHLVADEDGLLAALQAVDGAGVVALDLETVGDTEAARLDPRAGRVRLLTLATPGRGTFVLDLFRLDAAAVALLWEPLARQTVVAHNAAFDLAFLARLGFAPGRVCCTLLLSQLLHAGDRSTWRRHKLADCAQRELGRVVNKDEQTSDWSGALTAAQLDYAATDAEILLPLFKRLGDQLQAAGLAAAADIESRALPAVVWLSGSGVAFDRGRWFELAAAAKAEADRLSDEMDKVAPPPAQPGLFGGGWKWDSPLQVKAAFAAAGVVIESTDDDVLATITHPLADKLRDYRGAMKRFTTYGRDWPKDAVSNGRIHAAWWQLGADSGRMACSRPNLQNLPRDKRYRKCFVAPPGRVLVKVDYSQIELRIAAKVSGDERLLAAYRDGEDVHTLTARQILGKSEVTADDRQIAKSLNFGLLYGMGAKALRVYALANYGVGLTLEQAEQYRATFFRTYRGLAQWHRSVPDAPIDTRTLAGRRRLGVQRFAEKLNTPVQGTGADGLKLAFALLWERRAECPGALPVLIVHDEIVMECDADQADAVAAWVGAAMTDAMAPLIAPVPVAVEAKVAQTWGG